MSMNCLLVQSTDFIDTFVVWQCVVVVRMQINRHMVKL